jgi:hypothetical protein
MYKIKIFNDTEETEINKFLKNNRYSQILTTADKIVIITKEVS